MEDPLDLYHTWLRIPPEDWPPHHYRLLGIRVFESDPDVIGLAAERRMSEVRSSPLGEQGEFSQRILKEIAAARHCLLDPSMKRQHDRSLRLRLEAEREGIPGAAALPPRNAVSRRGTVGETKPSVPDTSAIFSCLSGRAAKRRPWPIPVALITGVVALVVLTGFLLALDGRPPAVQQAAPPRTPSDDAPVEIEQSAFPKSRDQRDATAATPADSSMPPEGTPAAPDGMSAVAETASEEPLGVPSTGPTVPPPATDPGRPLADLIDPPDPDS